MDVVDFIREDTPRALFPLRSVVAFCERGEGALRKYIYDNVLSAKSTSSFLRCSVEHALKDRVHLRKTLVLDPIANFFLYDFVLQNKRHFALSETENREVHGYGFRRGKFVNSFEDYHRFRKRKYKLKAKYRYFAAVDIANCFNSFYHHDFAEAVESRIGLKESQQIGQFLREINAGESVNCFPQGIYPAKVLGNWFLRFIEQSRQLRSETIIRFLDDVFLFTNKARVLREDVLALQQVLSNHALALNAEKTKFGSRQSDFEERELENIKKQLLRKRESRLSYDADYEEEEEGLEEEEREYLRDMIGGRNVAEEDVELALSLLRDEPGTQMTLASMVLGEYPHLTKALYGSVPTIEGYDVELWELLSQHIRRPALTAFELFWVAKIVIDYYEFSTDVAEFLMDILQHPAATPVVRAVILETPYMDRGFEEVKVTCLRNEPAGLPAVASVVGLRKMGKGKRNQLYKYAAKSGEHMAVLCSIMGQA